MIEDLKTVFYELNPNEVIALLCPPNGQPGIPLSLSQQKELEAIVDNIRVHVDLPMKKLRAEVRDDIQFGYVVDSHSDVIVPPLEAELENIQDWKRSLRENLVDLVFDAAQDFYREDPQGADRFFREQLPGLVPGFNPVEGFEVARKSPKMSRSH